MTEETKLLPCPFCGGAPEVVPSRRQPSYTPTYSIRCAICRARGPSETWTRPEAIDLWNKRAMPLQDHAGWRAPVLAKLEESREYIRNLWRAKALREREYHGLVALIDAAEKALPAPPMVAEEETEAKS